MASLDESRPKTSFTLRLCGAPTFIWTPELLDAFLANPQSGVFRGNRVPFAGMSDAQARADHIAYLEQATK
jgi:cytochrome c2